MKNYYHLNFPVELIRKDAEIETYPDFEDFNWGVWNDDSSKYLTTEAIKFIHDELRITDRTRFDNKLHPGTIKIFRGDKNTDMDIHRDRGVCWAINYSWGSKNSEMKWYEETENTTTSDAMCSIQAEYKKYQEKTMRLVERTSLSGPLLVRIDIPHNVSNYDEENYRWCVSIRDYRTNWTWEQAVEYFKKWIVNEDL